MSNDDTLVLGLKKASYVDAIKEKQNEGLDELQRKPKKAKEKGKGNNQVKP